MAPLPMTRIRVFSMTPNMQLVCAWARFRARTHVQLALACPTVDAEAYSIGSRAYHATCVRPCTGNLGNECADHAAALGALVLVSNHNLSARWTHHSFDCTSCFATCNNLGDVLEKLRDIRFGLALDFPAPKHELALCSSSGSLWFACMHHIASDYFSSFLLAQPPAESC